MTGAEKERSQRIIDWLTGNLSVELSAEEQEDWNRISTMDDLIRKYPRRKDVIAAFKRKYPKLVTSTVYHIFNKTKFILGSTNLINKNYERFLLLEQVNSALAICIKTENTKDQARLMELKMKILQLDKEDAIDPNELGSHTYILDADPKTLGLEPPKLEEVENWLRASNIPESLKQGILKDAEEVIPIMLEEETK